MKKKRERTLTPKLRFPEFRDKGEWETTVLGDVVSISKGKGIAKSDVVASGTTPCIRYAELYTIYGEVITHVRSRTDVPVDTLVLSQAGDVIIPASGETKEDIATCGCVMNAGVALGSDLNVLRSDIDGRFFSYYLNGVQRSELAKVAQGDTVAHLYPAQISRLSISVAKEPAEQHRIAECLSSLDGLIAAEGRTLEALRDHKRGLMQQLFPQPGQSQPRLRFPEFRDKGEWELRELSDFITERNQYPTEKVPLFSLTIENGVTPKTERYERSFLVNDEANAYKLVLPNDFAFNPMNLRFGAIGRHAGTGKVAVSKYYNIFSCDRTVDSRFCEIYFRSNSLVAFYDKMAIGSLIEKRRVHFAAFLKFNIRFPRLPEQQRIADCLTALDTQITAQAEKIETFKQHKRGLMQQLFPAPEDQ